jgi:hypothetical protein
MFRQKSAAAGGPLVLDKNVTLGSFNQFAGSVIVAILDGNYEGVLQPIHDFPIDGAKEIAVVTAGSELELRPVTFKIAR